jgi:hypothetical protein
MNTQSNTLPESFSSYSCACSCPQPANVLVVRGIVGIPFDHIAPLGVAIISFVS